MITDFITPINLEEVIDPNKPWQDAQLGKKVVFNEKNDFDLEKFKLAIIGVPEDRNSLDNHGCGKAPNNIRKELYQLFFHGIMPELIDLGNILPGKTIKDTQYALKELLSELINHKVTLIILGGGHDLTFGQFLAYEKRIHHSDLVVIDEKIDLEENSEVNANTFLWQILNHQPNYLRSLTHMGHQLFYTHPKFVDMLESLNFDAYRLVEMRNDMLEMEPFLRNADLVSFDISALRSADAPADAVTSPNGLNGEEACQLSRFAGISNKVSSFGLYEVNPYFDQNKQGIKQASQMIWYFIEGFTLRKEDDYPSENNHEFIKYLVNLESVDHEIIFWKSNYSNKWWMEIPQDSLAHPAYIPCSYKDYLLAMQDELPDKWMKVYNRLNG